MFTPREISKTSFFKAWFPSEVTALTLIANYDLDNGDNYLVFVENRGYKIRLLSDTLIKNAKDLDTLKGDSSRKLLLWQLAIFNFMERLAEDDKPQYDEGFYNELLARLLRQFKTEPSDYTDEATKLEEFAASFLARLFKQARPASISEDLYQLINRLSYKLRTRQIHTELLKKFTETEIACYVVNETIGVPESLYLQEGSEEKNQFMLCITNLTNQSLRAEWIACLIRSQLVTDAVEILLELPAEAIQTRDWLRELNCLLRHASKDKILEGILYIIKHAKEFSPGEIEKPIDLIFQLNKLSVKKETALIIINTLLEANGNSDKITSLDLLYRTKMTPKSGKIGANSSVVNREAAMTMIEEHSGNNKKITRLGPLYCYDMPASVRSNIISYVQTPSSSNPIIQAIVLLRCLYDFYLNSFFIVKTLTDHNTLQNELADCGLKDIDPQRIIQKAGEIYKNLQLENKERNYGFDLLNKSLVRNHRYRLVLMLLEGTGLLFARKPHKLVSRYDMSPVIQAISKLADNDKDKATLGKVIDVLKRNLDEDLLTKESEGRYGVKKTMVKIIEAAQHKLSQLNGITPVKGSLTTARFVGMFQKKNNEVNTAQEAANNTGTLSNTLGKLLSPNNKKSSTLIKQSLEHHITNADL